MLTKNLLYKIVLHIYSMCFPAFTGDSVRIRNDIPSFIRAMTRDLEYPGTYGTLKAPDRYARAVLGPGTTDMFYCRDTTGLRNCNLEGLTGGLNPRCL